MKECLLHLPNQILVKLKTLVVILLKKLNFVLIFNLIFNINKKRFYQILIYIIRIFHKKI
jgi:hypothetical protein